MVLGRDGNFYGTAYVGGPSSKGTVFKITPAGVYSVLDSFADPSAGSNPRAMVLAGDGNFYGTTEKGGAAGAGTIFRITPAGVLTTIHSFDGELADQDR